MKFKDLKSGDAIYSFNPETVNYEKLNVSNVSTPRIDAKVIDGMVVDITLDNQKMLVFKAEEVSGNRGNTFYTTNMNLLLDKIKSISNSIQERLDEVDKLKLNKKSCDKLLAELDPDIKERQKSEKRLTDLENKLSGLNDDISYIKNSLKKLIEDSNKVF